MEKHTMIALSTAHVSKETARELDNGEIDTVVYPKGGYGWFIPVTDETEDLEGRIPADLYGCIKYAARNNAGWVMFDSDVDTKENSELPIYNW